MKSDPALTNDERIIAASLNAYRSPEERAAMRGALEDAAHLCDAIAADVSTKRGRTSKQRLKLGYAAKRCGDAIWAMREKVRLDERTDQTEEIEWLRRLLRWCRPRLKHASYQTWLDQYLAAGPSPAPADDEPVIIQSEVFGVKQGA